MVSGPPGCGKSTLAGIASGLIDPDSGEASLDGIALDDLDPAQLRQTIRVVSEEPLLLAATLRDNLLLGAWGEIDDDAHGRRDAHRRCRGGHRASSGGSTASVGDRGLTVSGGQRQRVSLARALVAKPRVLILDDALSAVHPSLEIEIMKRVHQYLPADGDPLHHPARPASPRSPTGPITLEPAETVELGRRARPERAARPGRRGSA